jgi:AcrR family transcriptional regulator
MYHVKTLRTLANKRRSDMPAAPKARIQTASRQAVRTQTTRRKLLAAAERIFARDGFEAARLEDIAFAAGYTRGAFYASYESKEEIFLALLEHWVRRRIETVNSLLRQHENPTARLRALRKHYAQNAQDRRLALLSLEFKLYAIRHPQAHSRFRARQRKLRASGGELLRRALRGTGHILPITNGAAATGLGALPHALLLESLVDRKTLSDKSIRHILGIFFDAVLGAQPPK